MKTITNDYKNSIKELGRQLNSKITYIYNEEEIELGNEDLNSITPHYEGSILKSAMKQLDIDSNVEIPVGVVLNYQFGVLIDKYYETEDETYQDNINYYELNNNEYILLIKGTDYQVGDSITNTTYIYVDYEYINFGNYVVKEVEKQKDTNSWLIKCCDKMLYSMKDYESMGITYPITIRNYINSICNYLGLTFKNINDTFANYDKQIQAELYLDTQGDTLGYTFRDVLDELAQVTGSTICINEQDDELEIRYINDTGDTIDEEYLKNINVNFGELYGPINTVILSRASGSDKVYKSYPDDLPDEDKIAVEIADNQIMNFNDRADYLPDILNKLNGLQYYLNDYVSLGITYYELCDRYNVQIGEETYSCVMFNDEIEITQGLVENIHTDIPEVAKTDYTKADKTDRRINQTYLIVDKQNQTIESVVSNVSEQDEKISQINQTVDEINAKISDVIDITVSGETNFATFTLENVNESEPIQIKVKPISDNISYLYPNNGLYPSNTLYPKVRTIRFHNNTTNTDVDYVLPDDLLIYDSTHYDEFYLDYDSQVCQVTKRCKYNADGTVSLLANEQIVNYPYPSIVLDDGDYTLTLLGYEYGYLFIRLMAKNVYTTQFYTKAETNSKINQKANEIELDVNQTLSNYSTTAEMNSAINVKANEINSTVSQKVGKNEVISSINQTAETIKINANKINLTGYVTVSDLEVAGETTINGSNITTGTINCDLLNGGTINGQTINGGTITGSTINTNKNLTVGNNAYIGQNQSTSLQDDKYLYFSNHSYLRRTKTPSGEMFFMVGDKRTTLTTYGQNNANIEVSNAGVGIYTPVSNSTTLTSSFATNDIWFSVQPSIGSDERLKKDIKDIDVSWINELKVKEFEYKKIPKKKQIGLIAQDYENKDYKKYFLNTFTDENGQTYYSIAYGSIQNALIQYCQEMNKKIEQQQETINNLTQRIEKLEKESEK